MQVAAVPPIAGRNQWKTACQECQPTRQVRQIRQFQDEVTAGLEHPVKLADHSNGVENHREDRNPGHYIELFSSDWQSFVQIRHKESSVVEPRDRSAPVGGLDLLFDEIHPEHLSEGKGHHTLQRIFLVGTLLWPLLPVFGIGVYKNSSGDRSFELWYLITFMLIAFMLMHELITPLPPKD